MRLHPVFKLVLFIALIIAIEIIAFQTINAFAKTLKPTAKSIVKITYITLTVLFFALLFVAPYMRTAVNYRELRAIVAVFALSLLFAKIIIAAIGSIDLIKRGVAIIISLFYTKTTAPVMLENAMSRSLFLNKLALIGGGSIAATLLYGMSNRYNYQLKNIKVPFANLPEALKKIKIIQISDVHSGSFTDVAAVQKGIDLIMAQKPDLIFFTGDLVNNVAIEMKDYISVFAQLKAPLGVYSTLGNHDYGDYYFVDESQAQDKINNLNHLKEIHKQMGWQLLLNENKILNINGHPLAIIGVENISGSNKFHTYGHLDTALKGAENIEHKILLSHDPSHWDKEVNAHPTNIQLTLSGHTHGMQFGLELPFLKWSPVKYLYKQWAGLYQQNERFLYVNRGFGFLGYPGRVGVMPEITVIELV
jgi:uncharacterized protein